MTFSIEDSSSDDERSSRKNKGNGKERGRERGGERGSEREGQRGGEGIETIDLYSKYMPQSQLQDDRRGMNRVGLGIELGDRVS
jgi:hypothetical protein